MAVDFTPIEVTEITDNPFRLIGLDWMLIAAGGPTDYNMMTASWGGMGVLWNLNVAHIYVRPTRYTYEFVEREQFFSLNFFGEADRDILSLCGTKSGRDIDKMDLPGLTARFSDRGTAFFDEARLVLECRKIYQDDLKPERFLDAGTAAHYPQRDFHRLYVGEIVNCLAK